jgi:NADH:ubiquinone oxidoreductase subunit F (NADH-binding)
MGSGATYAERRARVRIDEGFAANKEQAPYLQHRVFYAQPTSINNDETLVTVMMIVRDGLNHMAGWNKGFACSKVFSISGDTPTPGILNLNGIDCPGIVNEFVMVTQGGSGRRSLRFLRPEEEVCRYHHWF